MKTVVITVLAVVATAIAFSLLPGSRAAGQAGAVTNPSVAVIDQARQAVLIAREINTGEVSCRTKNGKVDEKEKYLPWDALLNAPCFSRFESQFSQVRGFPFSPGPEIAPGLEIRLLVSPDGKHYSLWLGQKPVGNCVFAFYSDERGVIYEGASLGCKPPGVG